MSTKDVPDDNATGLTDRASQTSNQEARLTTTKDFAAFIKARIASRDVKSPEDASTVTVHDVVEVDVPPAPSDVEHGSLDQPASSVVAASARAPLTADIAPGREPIVTTYDTSVLNREAAVEHVAQATAAEAKGMSNYQADWIESLQDEKNWSRAGFKSKPMGLEGSMWSTGGSAPGFKSKPTGLEGSMWSTGGPASAQPLVVRGAPSRNLGGMQQSRSLFTSAKEKPQFAKEDISTKKGPGDACTLTLKDENTFAPLATLSFEDGPSDASNAESSCASPVAFEMDVPGMHQQRTKYGRNKLSQVDGQTHQGDAQNQARKENLDTESSGRMQRSTGLNSIPAGQQLRVISNNVSRASPMSHEDLKAKFSDPHSQTFGQGKYGQGSFSKTLGADLAKQSRRYGDNTPMKWVHDRADVQMPITSKTPVKAAVDHDDGVSQRSVDTLKVEGPSSLTTEGLRSKKRDASIAVVQRMILHDLGLKKTPRHSAQSTSLEDNQAKQYRLEAIEQGVQVEDVQDKSSKPTTGQVEQRVHTTTKPARAQAVPSIAQPSQVQTLQRMLEHKKEELRSLVAEKQAEIEALEQSIVIMQGGVDGRE